MGAGRLGGFHLFVAAVNRGDFETAAAECHRAGCRDERNAWCAERFRAAGARAA
jgi:hypothetical protein